MARAIVPKKDAEASRNKPVTEGKSSKRRCVSSACVPCRRRKSKCDGGTPVCATCIAVYKTECFYDAESETRRKVVPQKRDATVLDNDSSSTSSAVLIEALKSASEQELQSLIHQIRTEDNLDALADSLRKDASSRSGRDANPPQDENLSAYMGKVTVLDTGVSRVFGPTSGMGMVMEDESDTGYRPVHTGKHDTWTSVSRDTEFVEHCMQLYFDITHPFFLVFPQQYFWASYRNGDSKYCSPLLVNAIAALGCHSSDRPEARTDPNDARTAGDHFFAEAKKHLFDDETPSLTTVQALAIMGLREPGTGRDSGGFMYAGRCVRMAVELGLHLKHPGPGVLDPVEDEVRRVTFWTCFNFDSVWTICIGRISQLPRAAITAEKPSPSFSDSKHRKSQPDAQVTMPQDSLESQQQLYYMTLLSELVNDNVFMFYAPRERFTAKHLLNCYSRYRSWYRSLPKAFLVDEVDNDHPPSRAVLELLMWYHACILMLFRPLLKVTLTKSEVIPQDVCRQCADEISRLMRIYRQHHELRKSNVALAHMNLSSATIHLLNVATLTSRENLVQTMRDLEESSICVHFAARAVRYVCALAKEWGIDLPPEILAESKILKSSATLMSPTSDSQLFSSLNTSTRKVSSREHTLQPPQGVPQQHQQDLSTGPLQSGIQGTSTMETYQPAATYSYTPSYTSSDARSPATAGAASTHYQQSMAPQILPPQHSSAQQAPNATQSYRSGSATETSVAEQFFWHPFGGHGMPLLGTNMNMALNNPMALDNLLGNGDQWEQLSRDGFSFNDWNSDGMHTGLPHGTNASNGAYYTSQSSQPVHNSHQHAVSGTSEMKAEGHVSNRQDYYGFGSW